MNCVKHKQNIVKSTSKTDKTNRNTSNVARQLSQEADQIAISLARMRFPPLGFGSLKNFDIYPC
jgi:hypothetical protein